MFNPTPEVIVVWLGILLALWYLAAAIFNRRRGLAIYRWLHSATDRLGGELSGRWIGSSGSGAELTLRKADAPFRDVQIIYLLASRELLPLFLADLLRGKRDRLIVKANLRDPLPAEVEIAPSRSGPGRKTRSRQDLTIEDGPDGLVVGRQGSQADKVLSALAPFLEHYGSHLVHFSWSKKAPQLVMILTLDGLWQPGGSAASLYTDLAAFASAATVR